MNKEKKAYICNAGHAHRSLAGMYLCNHILCFNEGELYSELGKNGKK